jgi:hypothetical protein
VVDPEIPEYRAAEGPADERAITAEPVPGVAQTLRKDDHQAFLREFIFGINDGKRRILEVVPKEKTMLPPAWKSASA